MLFRSLLWVVGLVLVVLIGAIAWVVLRSVTTPIADAAETSAKLAAGDLGVRLPVRGEDELATLNRSFNAMADRLVTLQAENARQQRQALFGHIVAGLLHDLSHPVQNIGNNASLLLREGLPESERHTALQTLQHELDDLKQFMEDVRDAARPRPLDRVPVDVNASVSDVVDAVRAEAGRRAVAVAARLARGLPPADGDRFALDRKSTRLNSSH